MSQIERSQDCARVCQLESFGAVVLARDCWSLDAEADRKLEQVGLDPDQVAGS